MFINLIIQMLCQNRCEVRLKYKRGLKKKNVTLKLLKTKFFDNAVFFHIIKLSSETNIDQLSLLFNNIDLVGLRHLKKVYEFKEDPKSTKYTQVCLIGFFEKQRALENSHHQQLLDDIKNRDINLDVENQQFIFRQRFDLFMGAYTGCDDHLLNQNRNILLLDYVDKNQYFFTQYLQVLIEKKIPLSYPNQPIFKQLIYNSFQQKNQQRHCVWVINTHLEPFQFYSQIDCNQLPEKEVYLHKVSQIILFYTKNSHYCLQLLSKNIKSEFGPSYDQSVLIHTESIKDSIHKFQSSIEQGNITWRGFIEDSYNESTEKQHFLVFTHEIQKKLQDTISQFRKEKVEANFSELETFQVASQIFSFLQVFEHPDTIILKSLNFPKNYGNFQRVTQFLKIPEHRNGRPEQIAQLLTQLKVKQKIDFKQIIGKHETVIIAESIKKSKELFKALVGQNLKQISFLTRYQVERYS